MMAMRRLPGRGVRGGAGWRRDARTVAAAAAVLAAALASPAAAQDAATTRATATLDPGTASVVAFVGAAVVPMTSDTVLTDRTVLVRGDEIIEIGPRESVAVPADAMIVDAAGRYLMPGLADMHVHLVNGTGEDDDALWRQLALLVTNGVTSARSLSGSPAGLEVRSRIEAGELVGPRLTLAGTSVHARTAPTPEAARAMVAEQAAAGFDYVKTHGVAGEVYGPLVAAARAAGIPLVGHVTPEVGLERALAAGQQIEHLDGYLAALIPDDAPVSAPPGQVFFGDELRFMDTTRIAEVAAATEKAGVWNTPTLALFELVADPDPISRYLEWPEAAFMTGDEKELWAGRITELAAAPVSEAGRARYLELRRAVVRGLHAGGAKLLVGSDSPQFFFVPGFSLHREMEALQAAGLAPYDILAAATRNAAEYEGEAGLRGTVETGAAADLILLDRNPLADVANTRQPAGVMLRGRWLAAAALAELEERAGRAARAGD